MTYLCCCYCVLGWPCQSWYGETDILCSICSRETRSNWFLPGRKVEQRCCQTSFWVRSLIAANIVSLENSQAKSPYKLFCHPVRQKWYVRVNLCTVTQEMHNALELLHYYYYYLPGQNLRMSVPGVAFSLSVCPVTFETSLREIVKITPLVC